MTLTSEDMAVLASRIRSLAAFVGYHIPREFTDQNIIEVGGSILAGVKQRLVRMGVETQTAIN